MTKRRTKGDGGLIQRHDHPDCPPVQIVGYDEQGKPIPHRPDHACRGRWVGTVDVREPDGRTRRKYVYGRTQKQAQTKLKDAVRKRDAGTLIVASMTVEAWLTYWFDHIASENNKPATLRGYHTYVHQYLIPHLGERRLVDLRPEHIRAMIDAMRKAGRSPSTLKQAHAILRKALNDAIYERKLAENPAERMKSPSAPKNHRKGLPLDDARKVLASTDSLRWWLAVFYGMRQGECLGLRWRDIDFDALTITIAQTITTARGGELLVGTPKSEAGSRVIPMLPLIEARAKLLLAVYRDGHKGHDPEGDALVFGRPDGTPQRPYADNKAWHALLEAAGAPKVALHAARNTAASVMEAAKIPDRLIAQILGHAQVQMTHGYQHAEIARMRVELERAARLFEPGSGSAAGELPSPA